VVIGLESRITSWTKASLNSAEYFFAANAILPSRILPEIISGPLSETRRAPHLPATAAGPQRQDRAASKGKIERPPRVQILTQTYQVAWWTTQRTVNGAVDTWPDVDALHVKHLGIDEHRYRRVRWFRDPDRGGWRRVEPWMTTVVNAASGQVLGVVDGRDSAAVEGWLNARHQAWQDRIQIVAIDPSAAFKKAITTSLPLAKISVDPFHPVQLANWCLTRVRHRLVQEHHQRRGRKADPTWAHRTLLLRGYDTLSTTRPANLVPRGASRKASGSSWPAIASRLSRYRWLPLVTGSPIPVAATSSPKIAFTRVDFPGPRQSLGLAVQ
jgi:hypothetical protein